MWTDSEEAKKSLTFKFCRPSLGSKNEVVLPLPEEPVMMSPGVIASQATHPPRNLTPPPLLDL